MSDQDPADYGQHREQHGPSAEAALAEATEEADFRWLMADPRGRRIVRRMLERTGVFRSSFTGDALTTVFAEGGRNEGLGLIAKVQRYAPERLAEILTKGSHDSRS